MSLYITVGLLYTVYGEQTGFLYILGKGMSDAYLKPRKSFSVKLKTGSLSEKYKYCVDINRKTSLIFLQEV